MSHVVSRKRAEKEKQGLLSVIKGTQFENKVANYYAEQGFAVKRGVKNRYGEFDLVATKVEQGTWRNKRITLLIECKKKAKIPFVDFVKFRRKYNQYYDYYEPREGGEWQGIFAYVGELDAEIRPFLMSINDRAWLSLQPFRK